MRKNIFLGLCILSLMIIASAAYAITVQYINPSTGTVLSQKEVDGIESSSLPKIPLTLKFLENNTFTVTVPSLNITQFNPINVSFRNLSLSNLTNSTQNVGNSSYRYKVISAYAFEIYNSTGFNKSFSVEFAYSSLISGISDESDLKLFKADFNVSSNTTDFSTLVNTGATLNTSANTINSTVSNFSIFMLVEDQAATEVCDGIDNDYDGSTDEDNVCGSGGSTTSSSGRSSRTSTRAGGGFVVNCSNGIKDVGEKGIDCGPICGNTCEEEAAAEEPKAEEPAAIPTAPSTPREEAPSIIPTELIAPVEGVKKPIDLWTLVLGAAFVVVLIGGIALYRHEHMSGAIPYPKYPMEAASAGQVSAAEGMLMPTVEEQSLLEKPFDVEESVSEIKGIAPVTARKPKPSVLISPEAMEKLVNYIHTEEDKHFTKEMIIDKLLAKNWPRKSIEDAFGIVDSMRQSLDSSIINKLHKYIMKEFGRGFDEQKIKSALLQKEWPGFAVNEAFKTLRQLEDDLKEANLHVVSYDLVKAKENAKALMAKGYDKRKLLNALLLAGWSSDVAKQLVR